MVQLAAWLLLCAAFASMTRNRPLVPVCAAVMLWTVVPAVAAYRVTGQEEGALGSHPSSLLLLVTAVVLATTQPLLVLRAFGEHRYATLSLGLFLAVAVVTTAVLEQPGSKLLVDQVVAPLALFWLVVAAGPTDPAGLRALRAVIIGAVSLQCVLAILERIRGSFLLYGSDYMTLDWYRPDFDRWLGTTDNALVLALAVCVAAPLTAGLRGTVLRLGLLSLQTVGVVITQSRVAFVVMALVFAYLLLRGRLSPLARLVSAAVVVAAATALAGSSLVTGLESRVADDTGSAAARGSALAAFGDRILDFLFVGRGLTANYEVARQAGLQTSFESSIVMYAVDVGVVAALVYFGAMGLLVLRHWRGTTLPGVPAAAFTGLVVAQTFSALAYSNLSGSLLWAAVGLAVAGAHRPPELGDLSPTTTFRDRLRPGQPLPA